MSAEPVSGSNKPISAFKTVPEKNKNAYYIMN